MLKYIDTHTHLYDMAFDGEQDQVIARAMQNGVTKMLLPDIDNTERDKMFSLANKHEGVLYAMLGLYPGSVGQGWEGEIDLLHKYTNKNIVAIGEIGLDYYYSYETATIQQLALGAQFELAAKLNLPVNIHLRDASEDFVKIVKQYRHLGLRGNLHAFSASYETFMELEKYGDWYVGIGGVLTFKNAKLGNTIKHIPLSKILLETDAPYLTPTPYRGTRNESAYIPIIAQKLADIKQVSLEDVANITTFNAEQLFKI